MLPEGETPFTFDLFADDDVILLAQGNTTAVTYHMSQESYSIMNSNLTTLVSRVNTSTFLTLAEGAIQNSFLQVGHFLSLSLSLLSVLRVYRPPGVAHCCAVYLVCRPPMMAA